MHVLRKNLGGRFWLCFLSVGISVRESYAVLVSPPNLKTAGDALEKCAFIH